MPAGELCRKVTRVQLLTNDYLHHTEWTRRLGTAQLMAIAGILSLPFGVFVLFPYTAQSVAGPSCVISLLLAYTVLLIVGMHTVELTIALPKSCMQYKFVYASAGEVWAYMLGWTTLVEFCASLSVVARAWSSHTNLLFNGTISPLLTLNMSDGVVKLAGIKSIDCLSILGLFFAALLLCMSLRIAGTISIILLIVCALILSSTIIISMFRIDPMHWLETGFFRNGHVGVFQGAAFMMCSYLGIEALSFLCDETSFPKKRLPTVIPLSTGMVSLYLLLISLVITLVIDLKRLPSAFMLPQVYGVLGIPPARYVLSVGAVCGLSGAGLAAFLPPTRLLTALGQDALLSRSLAKMTSKSGSPCRAILLTLLVACLVGVVEPHHLMQYAAVSLSARLLVTLSLTVWQHYTESPIGLPAEAAHYKRFRRAPSSFGSASVSLSAPPSDTYNAYEERAPSVLTNHNCCTPSDASSGFYRLPHQHVDEPSALHRLPSSVSKYEDVGSRRAPVCHADDSSLRSVSLGGNGSLSVHYMGHNCVRSPCSIQDSATDASEYHMYDREVPELPYYSETRADMQSLTPVSQATVCRRALRLFAVFVLLSIGSGWSVNSAVVAQTAAAQWVALAAATLLLTAVVVTAFALSLTPTNDRFSTRKYKVVGFPQLTLIAAYILCLLLASMPLAFIVKFAAVVLAGLCTYFCFGYWNSVENKDKYHDIVLENPTTTENCPIIPAENNEQQTN